MKEKDNASEAQEYNMSNIIIEAAITAITQIGKHESPAEQRAALSQVEMQIAYTLYSAY